MNIVMSNGKPCESVALYFYLEENMLFDEDGRVVYNMFYYITPKQWQMFKHKQSYMCLKHKDGFFVELFYPDDEE